MQPSAKIFIGWASETRSREVWRARALLAGAWEKEQAR